jgi:hypothetical protein
VTVVRDSLDLTRFLRCADLASFTTLELKAGYVQSTKSSIHLDDGRDTKQMVSEMLQQEHTVPSPVDPFKVLGAVRIPTQTTLITFYIVAFRRNWSLMTTSETQRLLQRLPDPYHGARNPPVASGLRVYMRPTLMASDHSSKSTTKRPMSPIF